MQTPLWMQNPLDADPVWMQAPSGCRPPPGWQKDWHTLVKILPCPKLHLRPVTKIKCCFTLRHVTNNAQRTRNKNYMRKLYNFFQCLGLSWFKRIGSFCEQNEGCSSHVNDLWLRSKVNEGSANIVEYSPFTSHKAYQEINKFLFLKRNFF